MNILLCGDSFAADWNHRSTQAWWQQLSQHHDMVNVAQAGCSEYRILQQLRNQCLNDFDAVIICHTSPYRIYVQKNPLHPSGTHANSDLIFSDVENSKNTEVREHLLYWFQHLLDLDHARDMYGMIRREIQDLVSGRPCLHLNFFEQTLSGDVSMHRFWRDHPGDINHMDPTGNRRVYQYIKELINDL
jgi:hypothetical protein